MIVIIMLFSVMCLVNKRHKSQQQQQQQQLQYSQQQQQPQGSSVNMPLPSNVRSPRNAATTDQGGIQIAI